MLDAGTSDPDRVNFLKSVAANCVAGNLTRNYDKGDRVHVGGGDSSDCISRARSGGYQAHAWFSGCAGVSISGMRSALFMAHQNMLHVILFLYCVVNMQYSTAWVTEDMFDTFVLQKLN
jgi:hypothetical protein